MASPRGTDAFAAQVEIPFGDGEGVKLVGGFRGVPKGIRRCR